MEFIEPSKTGFTIYSKCGCINCNKVKMLIKETSKDVAVLIVECDDYIIEEKENFLLFIKNIVNQDCKQFPMVFYDGVFVGGYNETKNFINKEFLNFDF